jgi:hypothetical protein
MNRLEANEISMGGILQILFLLNSNAVKLININFNLYFC